MDTKKESNCGICKYLTENSLLIYETENWRVVLCQNQEYLGRSFVTLKRHSPNLSDLTENEWQDFHKLLKLLESTFTKAFGATHFNWTCLMNDAYKQNPAFPHVHWHLRPRYSHDVDFAGITFKDPEFGHHYARSKDRILNLPEEKLNQIVEEIRKNITS